MPNPVVHFEIIASVLRARHDGSGKGVKAEDSNSFVRVAGPGHLQELLPLPRVQSDMLLTERLIPASQDDPRYKPVSCSVVTIDEHNGISLTGSQCKPPRATVVDNGPVAYFAGAARDERSATVRVRVSHEKFLAAGVFDITTGWV